MLIRYKTVTSPQYIFWINALIILFKIKNRRFFKLTSIFILLTSLLIILESHGKDIINHDQSAVTTFNHDNIRFWLTDADEAILFKQQTSKVTKGRIKNAKDIVITPDNILQEMDGFGFTLNGGSALHLYNMSPAKRKALLIELFDYQENHIGVSYLRISIGSSDLDEKVFSYNDLSPGQTDVEMQHFSIEEDRKYLIPVLKEILSINPKIKILASPWSAPKWMKTNNHTVGGSLKQQYYPAYATYFVRYIQAMKQEGIPIDAITIQNEPLHDGNNPSMLMLAHEQAEFIKNNLGPAFKQAGIDTKIIIYDHNADKPNHPISVLDDDEANPYIDGSAFHLYAGDINALTSVHKTHPDKNIYFTEQWVSASGDFWEDFKWHIRELVIGAPRNWSKTVLEWNLAADKHQRPHTSGGCNKCLGALTISGDEVMRNPAYYTIAHIGKFVRPASRRIASTTSKALPNVAFKTTDNQVVIIVLNDNHSTLPFNIVIGSQSFHSSLSAGSVGTYVVPLGEHF